MKKYITPSITIRNIHSLHIIVTSTTGNGNDFMGDESWNNPNTTSSRASTRNEYENTNY